MTRQEFVDALGEEHILGMNPRCEWLIQQIMVLADAYAAGDSDDVTALRRQVLASRPAPPPPPPQEDAPPECRCGCGRPALRSWQCGLARACYQRWRYYGRPDVIPPPRPSRADRIEDYVELRSQGLTRARAAERLGVTRRTIERYEHDLATAGTPW